VKLHPEVSRAWCEALRSGKYPQTQKRLRTEEGFCCLGVLADILGAPWEPGQNYYVFQGAAGKWGDELPCSVLRSEKKPPTESKVQ
jgi:hypothetical protein